MKFKKGDEVEIVSTGGRYTGYGDWAKKKKLKNWKKGDHQVVGNCGIITATGKHEDGITDICSVKVNGKETIYTISSVRKLSRESKINFLLQYELDEDPWEEFETMPQVRKRIKELLERDDLKEDSMVVYEVKSVKKVTITKSIRISK